MKNKLSKRKEVFFFKLGGKWDSLQINEKVNGKFVLNKDHLANVEKRFGLYNLSNYASKELKFTKYIQSYMREMMEKQEDLNYESVQIPESKESINIKFFRLFDGESAHFTTPFVACFVSFILDQAWKNPKKYILGDHGTDTADIALLPLLDVYTFDTHLPPIIFTGSNRTSLNFDKNVQDDLLGSILRLTDINLNSGAYYVFAGYLYSASDFVKVYPLTSRVIDDFATFYAPHLTAQKLDDVFQDRHYGKVNLNPHLPEKHISKNVTYENLYKTLKKVVVVDLGTQREVSAYAEDILNPKYDAIVIAGHSLGNVPDVIKNIAALAALKNKLVILVSRCLIGEIKNVGATYLLNNENLRKTGKIIISGYKLNKNVAKALAVRALQEKLNQHETQYLVDRYTISRGLSQHNVITV